MRHTNFFLSGLLLCLFVAGPITGRAQPPAGDTDLLERLKAYRYGGDQAVLAALTQQVAESRSDPARRRQVAQNLAGALRSNASFEAKQFACRQLISIAGEEQVPALEGLLFDDPLAHYALLVLARVPGKAANDALFNAVSRTQGRVTWEILDTLAEHGDMRALPICVERLSSADLALAEAAAFSLAKLPDPKAAQALQKAYQQSSGSRPLFLGSALLDCARRFQSRGDATTALSLYNLLERDPFFPVLSAGALRGKVQLGGEKALPLLVKALSEDGTLRQSMAAGLARDLPGSRTTRLLSEALPKLTPRGQLILLTALGDRGDAAAMPAVMAVARGSESSVRVAALSALGSLGDASAIPVLLTSAASGNEAERSAARDSLALLRGDAVNAALLKALDKAPPSVQIEIIQSLGRRAAPAVVPRLLQEARRPQRGVSAAALRVLRDMAKPSDLPALVDLLLAAPTGEREPVLDAVTETARRGGEGAQGAGVLLARLSSASRPADRTALLTALGQVGGPGTLTALRKAIEDSDAGVRTTALSLLAEWPTDEPMQDLLRTVRSSQEATPRAIALRGYLRMIAANEQRGPEQALALFREAAILATRPEEKRLVLAGLAKVTSLEALEYASSFLADNEVHAEAELAVLEIGSGTLGAWKEKTRAVLEPLAKTSANEATRKRAEETLARLDRAGDFVTAWEVSPAYQQDGADYAHLFDIPFPPEASGQEKAVGWRLMPVVTNTEQPWLLDLLALWGGEQRVAYLRTAVWSESARDLVLETGSDDGLKAWWNGEVVLSHNVARAVAPGQEKVKLQARPGWNILLLKVTQNNQGWGACARFTNPDGSAAANLRFAVPSGIKSVDTK